MGTGWSRRHHQRAEIWWSAPWGLQVQLSFFHLAAANASTLLVLPAAEAQPEADVFCGGQVQF